MDTTQDINTVEWFFGYGGNHLGLKRVLPNLRLLAACEIEEFAVENILAKMEAGLLEAAPIWSDCKTFPWEPFVDRTHLFVASYPCQPFSAAGKRQGTEDERHLWPYVHRWILRARPLLVFLENVEGHISLGLSTVISDLEEGGYKTAWGIFSASEVGAPHQRKRVFILAHRECEGLERFYNRDTSAEPSQYVSADAWAGGECGTWPSRPGEQQHWWEPPRVVADARSQRRQQDSRSALGDEKEDGRARRDAQQPDGHYLAQCNGEAMGNTASKRPDACGPESAGQQRQASTSSAGDAMGHPNSPRPQERPRQQRAGLQGADADGGEAAERQTQPPLGRDADGPADWLDDAELYTTCDNRTDELRLLGNGVVPATAERAFRVLVGELIQHANP